MRVVVCYALLAIACFLAGQAAGDGPYQPNWASLDARPIPSWFDDAKFGIFIHWGVYSVPSWAPVGTYAEWYWYNYNNPPDSPTQIFHNETYGSNFKYQDFADMFKAELFDANEWAQLFVASGARYVVPTSKHHEGFTLWPSAQSWNWNAVDVGPHRDLLKEIMTAVRAAGLHAGLYFSLFEWYHPLYTGPNPSEYVNEIMLPQLYDLATNYQPDLIWTDGEWEHNSTFWQSCEFLAWLFNDSPNKENVVVNDRWGSDTRDTHGGYYTPEYSTSVYLNHKWEENSGIDVHSYGLNRNTPAILYNTAEALLNLLVRSVANGGNLLLDIGPGGDGRIPALMQERLVAMGQWLSVNGDAIYGTRLWRNQSDTVINTSPITFTQVVTGADNIFSQVAAKSNTSTIFYMGNTNSNSDCQNICAATSWCLSYVWHTADAFNGNYALNCYVRSDDIWSPTPLQPGHVSGRKDHYLAYYTSSLDPSTNQTSVYAIFNSWPTANTLILPSPIPTEKTTITMLGMQGKPLNWKGTFGKPGIMVELPPYLPYTLPCDYLWSVQLQNVQ